MVSNTQHEQFSILRQQIEDLAMQIILEGSDLKQAGSASSPEAAGLLASLDANLSAISQTAEGIKGGQVAAIANSMRRAVDQPEDLLRLAEALSQGVGNLQQAVESFAMPAPPPKAVNALAQDAE